ncbi:MAG: hypothetical protein ABR867_01510 [Nitrososphaerales archaeon]|jgi:hypothetical protein
MVKAVGLFVGFELLSVFVSRSYNLSCSMVLCWARIRAIKNGSVVSGLPINPPSFRTYLISGGKMLIGLVNSQRQR